MAEEKRIPDVIVHQSENGKEDPASSKSHRTVRLSIFLASMAVFTVLVLALSFGLGLGLGLHRNSDVLHSTNTNFNYSSFYGIPDELPIVPTDQLVNTKELDMQTGFVVSNVTQVREFTLNITQDLASPDGFQKPMILINGQFPGPLIEVNSGDTIRVRVNNLMANWSTSMHWHGIDQKNSVEMDGVASITQCGIPPNESFTYEFTTEGQRGSFWYHSHLSSQYTDGMLGPLVRSALLSQVPRLSTANESSKLIHDPDEMVPTVDDEKIIFVGDWHHTYSSVLLTSFLNPTSKWSGQPGIEPLPDNILMNGQNTYDCSVQSSTYPPNTTATSCSGGNLYTSTFEKTKSYRLRLINHSSFFSYWFSIDNHTVSIVEVDGVEIEPIDARGKSFTVSRTRFQSH